MRLGVLIAILGEMPELRDRICAPRDMKQDDRPKKAAAERVPRTITNGVSRK